MWRRARTTRSDSGFTLIEIMIVVLIISIILFIAVPSWIGARQRSMTRACIGQLREIKYAKESWAMENDKPQTAVPELSDVLNYLKDTPACPAGGTYTLGNVGTEPICSLGGDHKLY
ncbi:MAG: prepilin-type N-terminal cleavage/methylation domain-containing protein [Armatimonadota bacterium]